MKMLKKVKAGIPKSAKNMLTEVREFDAWEIPGYISRSFEEIQEKRDLYLSLGIVNIKIGKCSESIYGIIIPEADYDRVREADL